MLCDYKNLIGILPDGSLSICGIGIIAPELRVGDVHNDVRALWNTSNVFKLLRSITPETVNGVCRYCLFAKTCCNFCPAVVYSVYGDFFHSHPWCQWLWEEGLLPRKFLVKK